MPAAAVLAVMAVVANILPASGIAQPGELIERTLAIVAGEAITLSDVQTARALTLIERAPDVNAATERLIERALMLREVQRYAPLEPDEASIQQRLGQVRGRLAPDELARVLAAGGFTEARLRAWIRDDLRIAAYLDQRFASTGGGANRAELIADWLADLRRRTPVVELWKK